MPSARQFRDTYHSWKKLFLQNWTLFRASRIGVVGLAIMIAFVLVALAAPYVGLRDPIYWLAPESDTISVQQFWSVNVAPGSPLQGINASVEHSVAFRPARDLQAFDIRADRIYVPEGRRLFAFQTDHGYLAWPSPFVADDNISVDPVLANFGRLGSPTDSIFTLFLGTRAGTVYVMTDDYLPAATPTARSANFGSPVTGLAAFSGDEVAGMTDKDRRDGGRPSLRVRRQSLRELAGILVLPGALERYRESVRSGDGPTNPSRGCDDQVEVHAVHSLPMLLPLLRRQHEGRTDRYPRDGRRMVGLGLDVEREFRVGAPPAERDDVE